MATRLWPHWPPLNLGRHRRRVESPQLAAFWVGQPRQSNLHSGTLIWLLTRPPSHDVIQYGKLLRIHSLGGKMPKYSGSNDIYRELVEDSDENWLLGLLAFAVIEQQRIDWAQHRLETSGSSPTAADVQAWYEAQPQSAIVRAKAEAETALNNYGAEAIEEFDDAYRKEIAQGVVVAEIQKLGRWGPQLGMNVLGGVIGSIVFTAVLIIIAFFVLHEPSTNDIAQKIRQQVETKDGQVGSNK